MLYYAYACGFIFAMTRDFVLDLACTLDVNRWRMIDTALAGLESSLQGRGATCLLRHVHMPVWNMQYRISTWNIFMSEPHDNDPCDLTTRTYYHLVGLYVVV